MGDQRKNINTVRSEFTDVYPSISFVFPLQKTDTNNDDYSDSKNKNNKK